MHDDVIREGTAADPINTWGLIQVIYEGAMWSFTWPASQSA